ncbi:MAG TPA: hypothetical protein VMW49_06515 [Candidatus Dormibacteraeota bacterium]|nr:hypothetical protein [Candidatus Dormibacteraeota bacterium]
MTGLYHELTDPETGLSVRVDEAPLRVSGDEQLRARVAAYLTGPIEVLAPVVREHPYERGTRVELLQPEQERWLEACLEQAASDLGLHHHRRLTNP